MQAAARQYQECVRVLEAELGAEPEQETTALYELIRTRQMTPPGAERMPPSIHQQCRNPAEVPDGAREVSPPSRQIYHYS